MKGAVCDYDAKCMLINDSRSKILVRYSDVRYIKSENVYLKVVTESKSYLMRKKLIDMESELSGGSFVRIHRSYIVGLDYVSAFDGKSVIMTDGTQLPLSRGCVKQFKDAVMNYLHEF